MYLGIDIGTSSVKVVLIDGEQRLIASRSEPLVVDRPRSRLVGAGPESWIERRRPPSMRSPPSTARRSRRSAASAFPARCTARRSSIMPTAPLRPCILWNDGRAAEEAAALDADPRFRELTGNIVFPGFTAPKLVWVHKHEPEIFGDIAQGPPAEGLSSASGSPATTRPTCRTRPAPRGSTSAARDWSDELLAATASRPRRSMPDALSRASAATGHLRAAAGQPLGHATGGRDRRRRRRQCRLGLRRRRGQRPAPPSSRSARRACSSSPTTASGRIPASAVHAFCHALPDTWHQMGVMLSAAASLEWLAGVVGVPAAELADARAGPARGSRPRPLPSLSLRRADAAQRRRRRAAPSPASTQTTGAAELAPRRHGRRRLRFRRLPRRARRRRHECGAGDRRRRRLALARTGCRSSPTSSSIPIDVPADGDLARPSARRGSA